MAVTKEVHDLSFRSTPRKDQKGWEGDAGPSKPAYRLVVEGDGSTLRVSGGAKHVIRLLEMLVILDARHHDLTFVESDRSQS